jgi:hypothetical protein
LGHLFSTVGQAVHCEVLGFGFSDKLKQTLQFSMYAMSKSTMSDTSATLQAVLSQQLQGPEIQCLNSQRRQMLQEAKTMTANDLEEVWASLADNFACAVGTAGCNHRSG